MTSYTCTITGVSHKYELVDVTKSSAVRTHKVFTVKSEFAY